MRRVFVHIGLPKTATTYLQTILWANRDVVRKQGLLLPGRERRDHLWASRVVREEPERTRRPEREHDAWSRIRADLARWDGDGLVSHEFFAAANAEQAQAMVEQLAPAEVHVVVTAREPLGLFTASWQESLKNRGTARMEDYSRRESPSPQMIWNWRTLDLRLVLRRWSRAVPPERIHVLPLDPGAPREEIWHRFAALLGISADGVDLSSSFPNQSMGVVEAELLRRVNEHLDDFQSSFDRGVYIRTFLADERLVPRGGERYWPGPDRVEECRTRGDRAIAFLGRRPFDVVGDVELLRVPADLEPRRTPDTVTDAEVADAAAEVVAGLLGDVRELRRSRRRGRRVEDSDDPEDGAAVSRPGRWWRALTRGSGR
ncbi:MULTISPECIES: hypothetical protein [unclassified Nocardioides]|uniref:hypothetical protein n=1 Tax=unclassified Nocardioides TaxID=2615069 RepID=UPI0012E3BA51|nr:MULTISPECIES: hypothetical protein [unclassified Nocardioides]